MCDWENKINDILGRKDDVCNEIALGVSQYLRIKNLFESNQTDSDDFKNTFFSFYKIERIQNSLNLANLFEVLRNKKEYYIEENIQRLSIEKIHIVTASKIMHTINNEMPIYDSLIKKFFGLSPISGKDYCSRMKKALKNYFCLQEIYINRNHNGLAKLKDAFDNHFRNICISDVKKIDFMIWGWEKLNRHNGNARNTKRKG